jgi:UDP-glucose 4-epimerase
VHVRALQHLERIDNENDGGSLAVNLGTGRGHSVPEGIQAIENAVDAPFGEASGQQLPGDPPILVTDPSKTQKRAGMDCPRQSRRHH